MITLTITFCNPGQSCLDGIVCDQPELDYGGKRNPDGQGFAAFGKIIKGMDVVKRIHSIKAESQYLDRPLLIIEIKRADP